VRHGRLVKMARMKFFVVCIVVLVISSALVAVFSGAFKGRVIRVACIGDSITELSTYPTDLEDLLGCPYYVREFGVTGATVLNTSFTPYIHQLKFQVAKEFQPAIVIIMLGTNDARADTYQSIDNFVADYEQVVRQVQELESNPKIFLVKPPPIFENELFLNNQNLLEGVIPRIEKVANDFGLPIIDTYTPLADHPEYFVDGVHPNYEGASIIASEIFKALTN
jgi:acyl-CoA thioesterase-1